MNTRKRQGIKAWKLLARDGWCQGAAFDLDGRRCALMAIYDAYPSKPVRQKATRQLVAAIGDAIPNWNDRREQTKRKVINQLKRLDI